MICSTNWIEENKRGISIELTNLIYELAKTDIGINIENDAFLERLKNSLEPLRKYCKQYRTKLTEVSYTEESGVLEPCFAFSDNSGYYTLDGILKSIEE